jgi:hypothetical protein
MKNLAYHILDIAENSFRAKAKKIIISVSESLKDDLYHICITDDGEGMDKDTLAKVSDPFFTSRTTRKVGLGIPLFQQNALQAGGSFDIQSTPGQGTKTIASFIHTHYDRPPTGDLAGTITSLAAIDPSVQLIYMHKTDIGEYVFDSLEIQQVLEGMPLNHPQVIKMLKEMINENLKEIEASQE